MEITEILSYIFDKNFVKALFLLRNYYKVEFTKYLFAEWERISRFSTLWVIQTLFSRDFCEVNGESKFQYFSQEKYFQFSVFFLFYVKQLKRKVYDHI